MIDITRNAVWTEDCCGKMDLDFPFIDCDTRYWPDNTCKCHIRLCSGVYLYREHTLHEPFDPITIIESDYIEGNSKEECQMKARQWYNEHAVHALELAILKLTEKEENIDLAEKIKVMSDKQQKAMKDLEKVLFDSLSEGIDEMVEKTADATFFLILQASISANIPLKKAYETYFIKREEVEPLVQRFDECKISQYVSGEYRFRLMVRDEPIEIPEDAWKSYLGGLYERLIKKLEIDICK